jgi:hypothetical protein
LIVAMVGLVTLILASAAPAQTAQSQRAQSSEVRSPWKYYPFDRAIGDGGPAPMRDLTGTWAGPSSGADVPDGKPGDKPSLTPLGQELMSLNKPLTPYGPAGSNDPYVRYCDPYGFPRNMRQHIRGVQFANMPDRIIMAIQHGSVWREIWLDGRPLPADVGGTGKDALPPRYNGYSVGHWEDDYTFVVDTTGLDERTWLTGSGYPHSVNARVQERYKRLSRHDLQLSITVDDPALYTKPFSLGTENFRWIPNQQFDEWLCPASEVLQYLELMGNPAGSFPEDAAQDRNRSAGP